MPALIVFLIVWALIIIFLKFVEALTSGSLSRFLRSRNVTLKFGYVSFYTTSFNDNIEAVAQTHRNFLFYWFSAGVALGLVGFLLSVTLLSFNLYQLFTPYLPTTDSVFLPYPRIPFFLHQPPWVPSFIWQRFLPNDHHHSSVVSSNPQSPDLHFAALTWRIVRWDRPKIPPPPNAPIPPGGDCAKRNDAFRREVDSSVWIPGWLTRQKKRQNVFKMSTTSRSILLNFQNQSLQSSQSIRRTSPHRRKPLAIPPSSSLPDSGNDSPSDSPVPRVIDAPKADAAFLTPLIPGVTVPYADALPMLISVLCAAVVHELGHALAAAAATGGGVSAVGAFIALILPGAFVRLTGINDMPPHSQLRVYCAGAWHNAVTAVLALIVVAAIPFISVPFFQTGSGALVVHVPRVSPLAGHIHPGDVVSAIGTSSIVDGGDSFRYAVRTLMDSPQSVGFCLSQRTIKNMSRGSSCCSFTQTESDAVECFRPLGLSVRPVCLETSALATKPTCRSALECRPVQTRSGRKLLSHSREDTYSGERSACVVPIFTREKKQLVDVHVRSATTGEREVLFFAGYAEILGQSLTVSSYVPRAYAFLPRFLLSLFAIIDVPNTAERLLQYFASISLGLFILNMAPVIYLDGEASVGLFLRVFFTQITKKRVEKIRSAILIAGSFLLAVNLIFSLRSTSGR